MLRDKFDNVTGIIIDILLIVVLTFATILIIAFVLSVITIKL